MAKTFEDLANEHLDDNDALAFRTRIIEYIQTRQTKLASRKGNGFVAAKVRVLRFASIVMDSGRLRGAAETAANVAKYVDSPRGGQ